MYAVIAHSGQQFKVTEGEEFTVDRIDGEVGSTIDLTEVLLLGGKKVSVGTPTVDGATVTVEILAHELSDKRSTFKYVRTRRTRVGRGFRPSITRLKVQSIKS